MSEEVFDYIVVGAGSAGAVLATELAADGRHSVLLLESGRDDRWIWTKIPAGVYYLIRAERSMWRFFTEPETHMNGRRIFWPRGRNLGGSSTVNGMIWVHGDPAEYDHWRDDLGLTGWGHSDLLPHFRAIESFPAGDAAARGRSGPVRVTEFGPRQPLMDAFLDACEGAGIARTPDYNGGGYDGVGYLQFNTRRGWRQGTREAFLNPARGRANLRILTEAHAERVLFEGRRATGVEVNAPGGRRQIRARAEVILAAGAIQTPQLLELSGIGGGALLQKLGIEVLQDAPGVGENAIDHLHTRLSYRCRDVVTMNQIIRNPLRKALMAARFALQGTGLMTCSGQIAHALVRSAPGMTQPDVKIQLHWMSSPDARDPKRLVLDSFPGVSIGAFPLRPKSRGFVHAQSPDPMAPPAMCANYLAHSDDVETTLAAIRVVRAVAAQAPLQRYGLEEIRPGPEAATEDALMEFVRASSQTSYHPVGTCRMGSDDASVVDERLRVRGVEGLRVADASVFPTMCSANTNAPAMVVGRKAAQMILESV